MSAGPTRFAVIGCDLGSVVLFARNRFLCRLDVLAVSPPEARQSVLSEFPDAEESAKHFGEAVDLLRLYFNGEPVRLDIPVDLDGLNSFTQKVLKETRKIPYGKVASYAAIGNRLGYQNAARAVGQALKRNPIPIVIPCHRIVKADGSLGGFDMGPEIKVKLLSREGIDVPGLRKSMVLS